MNAQNKAGERTVSEVMQREVLSVDADWPGFRACPKACRLVRAFYCGLYWRSANT